MTSAWWVAGTLWRHAMDINGTDPLMSHCLQGYVFSRLPIRTLITHSTGHARQELEAVVAQAPQLEVLSMRWGKAMDEACLRGVASLERLTYLSVRVEEGCIRQLGETLERLPRLKAVGIMARDFEEARKYVEMVETVVARAPHIVHLTMDAVDLIGEARTGAIQKLGGLRELRSLDLTLGVSRRVKNSNGWKIGMV